MGTPVIQAFQTQLANLDRMSGVTKLMPNGPRFSRREAVGWMRWLARIIALRRIL